MNGYIHEPATVNRLDKVADKIEAAAYDIGLPVIIPDDGIAVLGDQCRFYATPATTRQQLESLRTKFRLTNLYPGENAFRHLTKFRKEGRVLIKAELCLPSNADFSVSIGRGHIVLDFSLSALMGEDCFLPVDITDLISPQPRQIPLGKTLGGETIIYDPEDERHAHILIAGQTRSGKTVLANTIIAGLIRAYSPAELRLFISSGKPEDVKLWEGIPHLLAPPTYDPAAAFAMLAWLEKQRRERARETKNGKPLLVAYLGEVSVLVELNPRRFSDLLESLVRLGGSEKIALICATQRPRGDQVGSVVARSQFNLVLCGRMANPQDGYLALGKGQTNTEYLPGRGAFISNNKVRFQAAFAAEHARPELAHQIINALQRSWEPQDYVELPSVEFADAAVGATRETDVMDVLEWIQRDNVETLSINAICTQMGWGYPRANRVFLRLQERDLIGTERDKDRRVAVLLENCDD